MPDWVISATVGLITGSVGATITNHFLTIRRERTRVRMEKYEELVFQIFRFVKSLGVFWMLCSRVANGQIGFEQLAAHLRDLGNAGADDLERIRAIIVVYHPQLLGQLGRLQTLVDRGTAAYVRLESQNPGVTRQAQGADEFKLLAIALQEEQAILADWARQHSQAIK